MRFLIRILLPGTIALFSWGLATKSPPRFALTVIPIVIAVITVRFAVPGLVRLRYQVSLSLLVGSVVLSILYSRKWVEVPVIAKGAIRSDKIWSITLQKPSQVVRRVVTRPTIGSATTVRIRVALEGDYQGRSFFVASVNGVDFGRMFPEGTQRGLSLGHDSLELIFDASRIDGWDFVEIELRQPVPDPALRIMVIGQARGTVLGENAAFFGDGFQWLRGVPVANTGVMVSGLPVVWLDGVY